MVKLGGLGSSKIGVGSAALQYPEHSAPDATRTSSSRVAKSLWKELHLWVHFTFPVKGLPVPILL